MYGYIRPFKPELKVREWETYQAVYCGLCAELKRRYGFAARFAVNYDFTFFIMLLAKGEAEFARIRCPGSGRKKAHCFAGKVTEIAADLSIIMGWNRLRDSLEDDGFFRKLFVTRPAALLMRRRYRIAAKVHGKFANNALKLLDELRDLEHNRETSASKMANVFANALSAAGDYGETETEKIILTKLLNAVGRLIYILDAADDLSGDRKKNRYNPLIYDTEFNVNAYLEKAAAEAAADFELLPSGEFSEILGNIFYLGIPRAINKQH
ncbi:MAG: DUF5685 family protein [Oscillospiraceae bacterium]|nr:DUF5685 family protein [Oscillospiraceae bacterium]